MDYAELTESAQVIVLAKVASSVSSGDHQETFILHAVEALKGAAAPSYRIGAMKRDSSIEPADNDFGRHRDLSFWLTNVGRSEWPCCLCGPNHSFRLGKTYLLFPDKLGAMKSAEVINDPADWWLTYVRARSHAVADKE